MSVITVLLIGDIIGQPGIEQIFFKLKAFKNKRNVDLTIANGENADKGFGISEQNILDLKKYGIDVITSGNHIWSHENASRLLEEYDFVLRPHNYPNSKGNGWFITTVKNIKVAVVNLQGRYFMTPINCPFQTLKKLLQTNLQEAQIIIVDFHAESSPEKKSLAFDFDGKISLLVGTHTHTQTADEMILPNGTGYITDLGMCGGLDSVIGMEKDAVLQRFLTQTVIPFSPSTKNLHFQALLAQIDSQTKKCIKLERINI